LLPFLFYSSIREAGILNKGGENRMNRYAVCQIDEHRTLIVAYGETREEATLKAEEWGIRTGKRVIVMPEGDSNRKESDRYA
jgi:hypothetical protein